VEKLSAEGKIEDAVDAMTDLWVVGLSRNRASVDAGAWELVRQMIMDNYEAVMHRPPETGIDFNMITSLSGIKVPVLVMVGDKDLPDMQEVSRIISEKVPGAERQVIHDAAHLPNLEHAGLFNRSVTDYLSRG
jgi:pimeloyl-ACP methyl ester carboxylesterase